MRATGVRIGIMTIACTALAMPAARATSLLQMNLEQLEARSEKVFRGTVLGVKPGKVEVGGGQLPTVTYRVRVDEEFKGKFEEVKEGVSVVEIRMVASEKASRVSGGVRHFSVFRDVPQLTTGQEYVLFMTANSRVGLSTTVGLGQGCFGIQHQGKEQVAVNGFANAGLFHGMRSAGLARGPARGPIPYAEFAREIRAVVGAGKE
jgi:hypothetical protein